MNYLNSKRWKW